MNIKHFFYIPLLTSTLLACSTIKKYKPKNYIKNKPTAQIQIDGIKTNFSYSFLGFGSLRETILYIYQEGNNCYELLGYISADRNKSSKFYKIPSGVNTYIKYERVVQKASGRTININKSHSFFVFKPVEGHKYRFILDESVKGMTDLDVFQNNSSGKHINFRNYYDEKLDKVYKKECKS